MLELLNDGKFPTSVHQLDNWLSFLYLWDMEIPQILEK